MEDHKQHNNSFDSDKTVSFHSQKSLEYVDHFSIDSESDESEILDPFEKYHVDKLLKPSPGKYISKKELIKKIADEFTEETKKLFDEIREEMKTTEDPLEVNFKNMPKTSLLDFKDLPQTNINLPKPLEDSDSEYSDDESYVSNIWQMMESNCTNTFQMSTPNFNAYQEQKPHWLDRPLISWDTLNASTLKCQKWLKDQDF
ncbi:unnamed protein product [Brassicogethes aeneus]|uniref:Uncharacterized protein n=1 Tax=Brassicogethes aeneus TaxID=1431903 RepID=A0A9P0F9E2_BRAAE|nr:unnamed protein product [Brassicogethes aeneus]